MKSRGPVGSDLNKGMRSSVQPLVPNAETVAAIKAARRGEFDGTFNSIEDLLRALHTDGKAAE